MKRKRAHIPIRTPIFLGCEGESEQGYGAFLNDIVRARDLAFHIEVVNLNPGAGDPLARVKKAVQEIKKRSQRRAEFSYRALMMDDDQIAGSVQKRQAVESLATENDISIIWQSPCHEAFLLRHFAGRQNANPPDSATSLTNLRQEWENYQKPMGRLEISRHIEFAGVERVSNQHASFAALLRFLTLIP
ncbi:MAG: RloB domain-containing protein [Rhizobium sp.]